MRDRNKNGDEDAEFMRHEYLLASLQVGVPVRVTTSKVENDGSLVDN